MKASVWQATGQSNTTTMELESLLDDLKVAYREIALLEEQIAVDIMYWPEEDVKIEDLESEWKELDESE
jgi:hypothetical protein